MFDWWGTTLQFCLGHPFGQQRPWRQSWLDRRETLNIYKSVKTGGVHERHQNPDELSSQARCQYLTLRAAAVREGGRNTCADDEHLPFSQNTEHHAVWQTLPRGKRGFTCFLFAGRLPLVKVFVLNRSEFNVTVWFLKCLPSEMIRFSADTCSLRTCFWLTTTFKVTVAFYFGENFSFIDAFSSFYMHAVYGYWDYCRR